MASDPQHRDPVGRSPRAGRYALPALSLLAVVWGYAWIAMKVALDDVEPLLFAFIRAGLSAFVLLLLLPVLRRPVRPRAVGWTALLGLLQTTGFAGLVMAALQSGGAGKTAMLVYSMPFWLLLMAWAVLGERLRRLQWLAFVLALAGIVLIMGPWELRGVTSSLLAIGGGLCWAASSVVVKMIQKRHEIDILSLSAWQMVAGAVPLAVIAFATGPAGPEWTFSFLWALLYNVFMANGLAWVLWLFVLRALPATTSGLSTLMVPVLSVLFAWAQLGEHPGGAEIAGMALIIIALGVLTLRVRAGSGANASRGPARSEDSIPGRRIKRRQLF